MTYLAPRPATGWRGEPAALSKAAMLATLSETPVSAKLAGRNTLDYTDSAGVRRIRLHGTDILTLWPNGAFQIDTGGWNTHTTRDRLNSFLPDGWSVYTSKGVLHLRGRSVEVPDTPFLTVCHVGARGKVAADISPAKLDGTRKLLDAFMRHVKKTGLPTVEESSGDPWVISPDSVTSDTMRDWLETRYFTRTFYVLALRRAGITDSGIGHFLHRADRNGGYLDARDLARVRRFARLTLGLG